MKPGVSLIYPHFRSPEQLEKLFPPLGIAYLASQLKEAGIPVRICDCTFKTPEEAVRSVAEFSPLIVGISVMITMRRDSLALLESLRKRLPGSLFIAGGPLPTLYPDRFARSFDLEFCGEADLTFARFCNDFISAGITIQTLNVLDLPSYPGLYIKNAGGKSIITAPIHNPEQIFKNLPLPDRSGFDHPLYQRYSLGATGRKTTSIMITRGCPYSCDFCSKPIWGKNFRKPPLERVFEEIEEIISLGYDQLWIADDCFTLDLSYLSAFCKEMIARKNPIGWTCLSRVDRIDREIADLMSAGGCERVYLGLESGSDETLSLMGKHARVGDGVHAVQVFREAGIGVAGFFIVGYPGESHSSVEKTLAHALSLPLDEISINVPFPLPGSGLYSRVGRVDPDADWDSPGEVRFIYQSAFDQEWIRRRIAETLETFANKHAGKLS
jgi:anaerobic magnesium-protoporphyrin IX monomethyl ester cyclase